MDNSTKHIPFAVIVAATIGDEAAIQKILDFYDGYISKLSLRKLYDEYGNVYMVVDSELKGRTELPHMCDVLKKLPLPDDRQKAVYVMHMPPAGLRLGQLRYQDLDIGSVDIYEFLKEKQPLLSLHGHIHESPDTEKGKWINQIHQTTCIQTGQTELNDKYMVYAEIDLQEKKYERKVISVD